MPYRTLILGASYGSLLGLKFAAAGHDVTYVCRAGTAALINAEGTEVRITLRGEESARRLFSRDLAGRTDAVTPEAARPEEYDLVCLAMQEPQYSHPTIAALLTRIAGARVPCVSIMNMPPPPYLRRVLGNGYQGLGDVFLKPGIWDRFDPALMTLCSPDPQAFRPPEEKANVLQVGLPTNFKVSAFGDPRLDAMLAELEAGIDAWRIGDKDVPVKFRLFASPFVPFAKWAMLATGNYRCVTPEGARSIRDAVHGDLAASGKVYDFVTDLVVTLGADPSDLVPFAKYAEAARNLLKPSSAARAVEAGAPHIERVDKLILRIAAARGLSDATLAETVRIIDAKLARNRAAEESAVRIEA